MKFLAIVKSWWAAHLTLIVGVVAFLFPSVQQYAARHPGQAFAGILTLVVGAILSPARPTQVAEIKQQAIVESVAALPLPVAIAVGQAISALPKAAALSQSQTKNADANRNPASR